jgi:hypothetical protein
MDLRLRKLLDSYIDAVAECVDQLVIAGAKLPSKDYEWPPDGFKPSGKLPDGRTYRCHGVGCEIKSTKGRLVDFDFGENGEIGGFSLSPLLKFVGDKPKKYGFASRDEISVAFNDAITEFHFSGYTLYYLSEDPRTSG